MAWVAPRTWVTNEVVTAAMMNQDVRDNSTDLDSRTTTSGAEVTTSETTTSTAYTDLATSGPAVTVTTGTVAMVSLRGEIFNSAAGNASIMSFAISGATTSAAADAKSVYVKGTAAFGIGGVFRATGLTAGSNTFTAKYRVDAGTGTFVNRQIIAWPGNKL